MGAHLAPLVRASTPTLALALAVLLSCMVMSFGDLESDALLKFRESLANAGRLNGWNPSIRPCTGDKRNWIGVICMNGSVFGLKLERMGLMGLIDLDALISLPYLRTLSFMHNSFEGPLPSVRRLGALKSLYLTNNSFSGSIPDDAFAGMRSLKKVFLGNNKFTGKIPSSLAELPKLLELRLDNNHFEGRIPNFRQKGLKMVNLSNNELEGPIPVRLSMMAATSFSGNEDLCGQPLDSCNTSGKVSALRIALIVIVVLILLGVITIIFILCYRRREASQMEQTSSLDNQNTFTASYENQMERKQPEVVGNTKKVEHWKLTFVREERQRFDLNDLLRASAEVLGSGTFGASYKAVILNGEALVVKRYKQMNSVGREEFNEHMRRLGRLLHPNLLPLVAYYYRKEEKLLVSDFVDNGSLASHLHGNRPIDQPGLDWPTRLKIIKGIVRGLTFLYSELPSLVLPHGHLKSSNILLDQSFEPILTDYALLPVINIDHARHIMIAYKSPEYAQLDRTTRKTDVWSLGIVILELLTGKFPENYLTQGYDSETDIGSWVRLVFKEEGAGEVFDKEMKGQKKGEMLKVLKIGLRCCEVDMERRLSLDEVVEKIEELQERDNDIDYSPYGNNYSAGTEEELSFSMPG